MWLSLPLNAINVSYINFHVIVQQLTELNIYVNILPNWTEVIYSIHLKIVNFNH